MATRDLHQRPLPLRLLGLLLIALAALVAAPAAFLLLLSPTEWMLWAAAASIVPLIALGSWLMVGDQDAQPTGFCGCMASTQM